MTDPLVDHVLALGLAALFASAAWHKLSAGPRFAAQLEAYELLPSSLASSAARALAFGELALAVTLVLPPSRPAAAVAAAGLLALYGGAIAINLWRGRDHIDCGCGDAATLLSPWLLARNGALALGALVVALPNAARPLGFLDLLVGATALLALVLLWAVVELLLENASQLREWNAARD